MTLNVATGLRESAKKHPERNAIILAETQITYAQLHEQVQRFAGALKGLGLEAGQHIAIMLPNVPHFTIAYYGGHYAANPIIPLNVLLTADEIAYHIDDSDAAAMVVWEDFLPQARKAFDRVDTCKHLIVAKADPKDHQPVDGGHNMAALIAKAEPVRGLPATMPDDTAVILYTSGTTGHPKGAELSHLNLFYNAEYSGNKLTPLTPNDVALTVLPLFHSFGQTVVHNATLFSGGTLVMLPRFEPETAMTLMQKHRVTFFAGVPTMYFALLNHPQADKYDLSSLRYSCSGGSAMPVEVMRAFDEKYGVNILEGYGLSETSPVASFNTLDRPKKPGSIGMPLDRVEFKLVDTEDPSRTITEPGTPGEICIKGINVMKGYYNKPEANRDAFSEGGWFHTGDVAHRDTDGYYFIVDRKKDMVIRGGYNVYPREIEELLFAHPAIAEAAVIGVPHERHGEEIKAIVAFKPGKKVEEQELIDYCKERLAAYKYPRLVEVRDELPKGPTGKILKKELRKG